MPKPSLPSLKKRLVIKRLMVALFGMATEPGTPTIKSHPATRR